MRFRDDGVSWGKTAIYDVIALGRIGKTFAQIARHMGSSSKACEGCWHLFAAAPDLRARALARPQGAPQEETEANEDLLEPATPEVIAVPAVEFRFEDDSRAIAQCREPRYMPARITSPSGPGCSAAYTAGV